MAFWGRKKQEPQVQPVKRECQHKYRDFPWYIECQVYGNHTFEVRVVEPYVCVWCGHRKDVTLQEFSKYGGNKEARQAITGLMQEYGDHIQARAFIENDIHDMQLVDRDYLRALAIVNPGALVGMDEKAQVAVKKS